MGSLQDSLASVLIGGTTEGIRQQYPVLCLASGCRSYFSGEILGGQKLFLADESTENLAQT